MITRFISALQKGSFASLLILATAVPCSRAEERLLLAADTQVIEVNRAGKVSDVLHHPGHTGIYDAWRLPDGGIAYAHAGGLAVFDRNKKCVLEHAARASSQGTEANSCMVLDAGMKFALLDSGVCQIRTVDRHGVVGEETPLPNLTADPLHFRYRMFREVPGEKAFWVGQYGRQTLLKIERGTGRPLQSISLATLVKPSPLVNKAFAVVQPGDGSLFISTSTGCQLLHLDAAGKVITCWTRRDLNLDCLYLLGLQCLPNGNLLVAGGDYHLKSPDEGRDVLAEIDPRGKVVWRLTREQLVDQVSALVDPTTGLKELRITNVHAYDHEHLDTCLRVKR